MTLIFEISSSLEFYNIKCTINALEKGRLLHVHKQDISNTCIELVRLIREDTKKYLDNKTIRLNVENDTLFTTSTTMSGFSQLKKFLKNEYYILTESNISTPAITYAKTFSDASIKYYYRKIEEFRCAKSIELISDLY